MSFEPKPAEFSNASRPYVYTVSEAADLLRVKPATIYAEIRSGRLVARRVGKEYRIHPNCLDDYATCQDQESRPASGRDTTPRKTVKPETKISSGSSSIPESKSAPDIAVMAAEAALRKLSRGT